MDILKKKISPTPRSRYRKESGTTIVTGTGSISSTGTGSGGGSIDASLSINQGEGILIEKNVTPSKSTYIISHGNTSDIENVAPAGTKVINSLAFDQFGHVTDIGSIDMGEAFDERYLRKDIDDEAFGIISFDKSIKSTGFEIGVNGWQINEQGRGWMKDLHVRDSIYSDEGANSFAHENGFKIWADGGAWMKDLFVKKDVMVQGDLSSPFFVSGFPAGIGWALTWRDVVNAAGVAAKKAHLEIDDLTVRGILRVYEMIISQLLGENGTHLTTDMMKIKSVDKENKIIYLDTEEGTLYNPFWTDDILMVQRFNGMPTTENGYYVTRQYELAVEETHIGDTDSEGNRVDWIKYKNFSGNEDGIIERDTLVRVDNLTNPDRKGVIKQTSVEIGSPFMDIIYGMKTDPENATRTRVGKLEGLITSYWGRLQDYGIMSDNVYLKGKFMLQTGEDVATRFEIVEGKLNSEISALRAEISDTDNCLTNASFASDLDKWDTSNDVSFFTVNNKFLYFNNNFYSDKNRLGVIVADGSRRALRLKSNSIKQLNANLKNKPAGKIELEDGSLVWPSFYISFRYKVLKSGTLTVGFSGQGLYHTEELVENTTYETKEYSGRWDGTGDFFLSFTGDIRIYSLAMASNPLEDFKAEFLTRISQTEREILLHAEMIQEVGNRMTTTEGNISVMAGDINIWASRVTEVEGRVTDTEYSIINVIPGQISAVNTRVDNVNQTIENAGWISETDAVYIFAQKGEITGDKIVGYINVQPASIKIAAKNINLTGAVTFSAFDASLQSTVNGKANSSSLGYLAYYDKVYSDMLGNDVVSEINNKANNSAVTSINTALNTLQQNLGDMAYRDYVGKAMLDSTIIIGGFIATTLINADAIVTGALVANRIQTTDITTGRLTVTQGAKIGAFEINSYNGLTWKGYDYFGGTAFSLALGTNLLNMSTSGVSAIIGAASSTAERSMCVAGVVSAFGVGIYGSSDGYGSNVPGQFTAWAGFFSGNIRTTGTAQIGIVAAQQYRVVTSFNAETGAYSYYAGIDVDPGDYDLDDIRFRIRKGIIIGVTNDSGGVLRGV
ncbi:hypothetical protein [Parabacteroides sp. Marseille-P3160]|uniref:hypothetical protein n=1 Tax=Parabacteroides sp. Marseille-P3160 TaxID=1917887 RepID=UPI0009BAB3AC|nr:hypothetical protein [Parabacteroides sp. Marseille-P3160]